MAKDKKKDAVERFMDRRKLAKAKSENLKVIPTKPKAKKIKRTGKCSPGKVLKGGKCVPKKQIEGPMRKKPRSKPIADAAEHILNAATMKTFGVVKGVYKELKRKKKKKK